tara:strand:- start:4778 stop:5170 length:393 start_codon:yes stop_codon:yes gene_type:complete
MLAKDYIQSILEEHILPNLARFVKKHHTTVDQKVIQGEFFTLIRRHLSDLTNEKASYSINLANIDIIGINREGTIISIGFTMGPFNRYSRAQDTIELLNDLLDKSDFDYSKSILAHNLTGITDSLRYAQF